MAAPTYDEILQRIEDSKRRRALFREFVYHCLNCGQMFVMDPDTVWTFPTPFHVWGHACDPEKPTEIGAGQLIRVVMNS